MPRPSTFAAAFSVFALLFSAMPFTPTPATPAPALRPPVFDLQGHRGARGARPENTWPAFRYALGAGVVTLEMDAAITADEQVVLSHEPWMPPAMCRLPSGAPIPDGKGQEHVLFEMDYARIARYNCGSMQHPDFPEQQPVAAPKPLLVDVLREADGLAFATDRPQPFFNIETKTRPAWDGTFTPDPETFTRLLIEAIEEAGVERRTIIQSFDPRTLRAARAAGFPGRLALLVGQEQDGDLEAHVDRLGFTPDIYSPAHQRVDAPLVEAATRRGMDVVPWTVNDPDDMRRLQGLGVSGLITDYPARGQFLVEE